jgi:hypothetical protein
MLRRLSMAVAAVAASGTILGAQQPGLTAAASTRATIVVSLNPPRGTQGVAPATISIDYGQPHLRGRRLHTPGLVPLDSVWRLGANASTTLETGVDLAIGGQRVPAGKYSLYALPAASGWKLIVNKNTGQWGTEYVPAQDLVRVDLRKRSLQSPVESFSMWLIPSTQPGRPSGELRFAWGDAELTTTWSMIAP